MEINMEHQLSPCISRFNNTCSLLVAIHVLIKQVQKRSNFLFSPLSFHSMLSLIALGSEGPTLAQLLFFLDIKGVDELNFLASHLVSSIISPLLANNSDTNVQSPIVSFINGAWLDQRFKLKPSFEEVVRNVYHATASEVDFLHKADQVTEEINSWAERETRGLMGNLLPEDGLDEETVLVLANALYFKGTWDRPFDASKTEHKDFNLLNGEAVQVPFMTTNPNQKHFYASSIDHQVLKVPYRPGHDAKRRFSMCFFLPTCFDSSVQAVF